MQHAGLQYGQGAANSHQSPPFALADLPQSNGGNTTSSLRQFRKKDGTDKTSSTDLNPSIENSHIARVAPHNHYPARPNDYYRYQHQHQYQDYNSPFKETPAQVKYSEIAETPPQPLQHVDHLTSPLPKHKDVHKDFMEMCNISQQTHMKQSYSDALTRQQSYPPDGSTIHHQYPGYKPESQYQQYPPQVPKYNVASQCRKYPPPPPENDFLAKLQRINPSMARSIMSDHHIRESQGAYPIDQNRMYAQNQRYYGPAHVQNNLSYNYQYNYPSSCSYKHDYARTNQMAVGGAQYPTLGTDRSMSPRNLHVMNYGAAPQKISPNYAQYNPPEYAQHYQHRRASLPQEYYQQGCRTNPYMGGHQISPEPTDNRGASGGLRHFIENWAEEEAAPAEITPIFKENMRIHNNDASNEQVFVINSSDIPQCLENVSLVPTENGQFIIKAGALDNSVVRIKETTENDGERTVNLQIVESTPKPDCMLAAENEKNEENPVPYQENLNQNQNEKDCDENIQNSQIVEKTEKETSKEENEQSNEDNSTETSVIVDNEVSVIKDMPLIDEEHKGEGEGKAKERQQTESRCKESEDDNKESRTDDTPYPQEDAETGEENHVTIVARRTQRIFSVDDIINNIGSLPTQTRRNSLQFIPKGTEDDVTGESTSKEKEETESSREEMEYRNAISVEDDSVILEIGGAWVQLHINHHNGTKVLSVMPLSDSLVIDVNGNYQACQENEESTIQETTEISQCIELDEETKSNDAKENEECQDVSTIEENLQSSDTVEENLENDTFIEDSSSNDIVPVENLENEEDDNSNNISTENNLQNDLTDINSDMCQTEVVIGEEIADSDIVLDLNSNATINMQVQEEEIKEYELKEEKVIEDEAKEVKKEKHMETPKITEVNKKKDEKRKSRDGEERRKSSSRKIKHEERRESEERVKAKKVQKIEQIDIKFVKKNKSENDKFGLEIKKESEDIKKKDILLTKKYEKKLSSQVIVNECELKKEEKQEDLKAKKPDRKLTPQSSCEEEDPKKKDIKDQKKIEKKVKLEELSTFEEERKVDDSPKMKKQENSKQKEIKKLEPKIVLQEQEEKNEISEDLSKLKKTEKREESKSQETSVKLVTQEKKPPPPTPQSSEEEEQKNIIAPIENLESPKEERVPNGVDESPKSEENNKKEILGSAPDVVQAVEEMITLKQLEESKEIEKFPTKAAKKLYIGDCISKEPKLKHGESKKVKKSIKIEETVNKIKSLKEKSVKDESKKTSFKDTGEKKSSRISKKVTFNLETKVREISKEEIDRKKVSWEEYNSRKRRFSSSIELDKVSPQMPSSIKFLLREESKDKIMENIVTSSVDINNEAMGKGNVSIENTFKDSPSQKAPPKRPPTNWEDDTPSPESPNKINEVMSMTNRKCIIDVNEFNIKPIESVSTPSPVSSSQFSYHSEDDSLQVYKDVVDSKLNSLNIKIPKLSKPKPIDRFSILLDRFLNKGSLNCEELAEVKKFIEIKRKMMAEEKKLTYEVRNERDYKDLKLHFRKVPEKRKKKRFRNLYAEDSSDDSDSSRSEKGAGDYSVYQRDSQGVPKLIIKRNSGLPQPFVKLERSEAVELLAKKRKLY